MKVKKVLNKHSDPLVVQTCEGQKNASEDQFSSLASPLAMNAEPPDRCSPVASTSAIHHIPTSLSSSQSLPSTSTSAAISNSDHCQVPPLKDFDMMISDESISVGHSPPSLNEFPLDSWTNQQILNQINMRDISSGKQPINTCNHQTIRGNGSDVDGFIIDGVQNSDPNMSFNSSQLSDPFACSESELEKLLEEFVDLGSNDNSFAQFDQYLPPEELSLTPSVQNPIIHRQTVIPHSTPSTSTIANNIVNNIVPTNAIPSHTIVSNSIQTIGLPESATNQNNLNSSMVSIDLSEDSDYSPKTNDDSTYLFPKVTPIACQSNSRRIEDTERNPINDSLPNHTPLFITNGGSHTVLANSDRAPEFRSQNPAKPMPFHFNYCAEDYRIFNFTRTSNRNKSANQSDDYDYDVLKNVSWAECDGSQYEAKVKKWNDNEMSEDRRKEILRSVQDDDNKKFVKSAYESDRNVFYWWRAFKDESYVDREQHRGELKCVMRLNTNAVKGHRFTKYETRLFILVGTVFLTVENGKQKKTVDVGYEVAIPPHTRFGLENKSPDECYIYCIISH